MKIVFNGHKTHAKRNYLRKVGADVLIAINEERRVYLVLAIAAVIT